MPTTTRFRSQSNYDDEIIVRDANDPGGTGYNEYNWSIPSPFVGDGFSKSISDVPHPGYRNKVARGEIVLGDLDITSSSVESDWAEFQIGPFDDWGRSRISGKLALYCSSGCDESEASELLQQMGEVALLSAYAKMNQSPLLTGEFLSDFGKTISMLRRPFSSALTLLAKMNKYRLARLGKTVRSATKAASNAWLEYRYGWRPLILDAETAIDETHKFRQRMIRRRLVARGSEQTSYHYNDRTATRYPSSYWVLLAHYADRSIYISGRAGAGVIYDVESQTSTQALLQVLGLRGRDLPATIWEIIPYSFVADWFVNVGSWLQAVMPDPNVIVRGNWVTRKYTLTQHETATLFYPKPSDLGYDTTASVGSVTYSRNKVIRDCNQSLTSLPVVQTRKLGRLRSVDALSLMAMKAISLLQGLKH